MKYCSLCSKFINEKSSDIKWIMIITKRGMKIIEFECFHFDCWKKMIFPYNNRHNNS